MTQRETKYFKTDVMVTCPCGCGATITNKKLWEMLDRAREIAGVPFRITSGMRCPHYNDVIKGFSKTSSHRLGLAVDIATPTSSSRFAIVKALLDVGFTRIGYNGPSKFIHVDIDHDKPGNLMFDY